MHRIDADAHVGNQFDPGDPGVPRQPTQIDADWLNAVQENICAAIEDAGIALVKGNANQLRDAIRRGADTPRARSAYCLAQDMQVDANVSKIDSWNVSPFVFYLRSQAGNDGWVWGRVQIPVGAVVTSAWVLAAKLNATDFGLDLQAYQRGPNVSTSGSAPFGGMEALPLLTSVGAGAGFGEFTVAGNSSLEWIEAVGVDPTNEVITDTGVVHFRIFVPGSHVNMQNGLVIHAVRFDYEMPVTDVAP